MEKLLVIENLDQSKGHGRQPDGADHRNRLTGVMRQLREARDAGEISFGELKAPSARRSDLLRVHPEHYLTQLEAAVEQARVAGKAQPFGKEVLVYGGSMDAAVTAVGAGIQAVDAVMTGRAKHAFVAVRSLGHHCEPELAMGYALLSNAAIATLYARDKYDCRVGVIDLDNHSGNGSVLALANQPAVQFVEVYLEGHPERSYPYPGEMPNVHADNILQVGLPTDTSGDVWLQNVREKLIPVLIAHKPKLIIISFGFDCMLGDPLGALGVTPDHVTEVTRSLVGIGAPIVSFLEGGYKRSNLKAGVLAHCKVLAGQ